MKKLKDDSISYSKKSEEGFAFLRPYYRWQLEKKENSYIEINNKRATEISALRDKIREEHQRFIGSTERVIGTGSVIDSDLNQNNKIEREFNYVFNGFTLNISEEEANAIKNLDDVKEVYPNYKVSNLLDSSVPAMKLNLAEEYFNLNGSGVVIAVIDTGIDGTHESLDDLDDNPNTDDPKVIGWMDYVNFRNEPYDDHGHGTHCSGIAAGTGRGSEYIGVAPGANLVGIKVLDEGGGGTFSEVIAGIEWVVQHKDEYNISVISMSLGASVNSDGTTPVEIAADYAVESGINFAVAAGNAGGTSNTVGIPASAFNVTTVGAVDDKLNIAGFSSKGPTKDGRIKPEISAVGVDVTSSVSGGGYEDWSGTSMATPHIAGLMALLLQQNPSLTPTEIKELIKQTATDKGVAGPDNYYGWGAVDGLESFTFFSPPEHEVGLIDSNLDNFILGEEKEINVKIKNYGLNDEDIELKFFVDEEEIESKTINLLAKEIKDVEFIYTENEKGNHEVKIELIPVSEELFLTNNEILKQIYAVDSSEKIKAVVLESWGSKKSEYTIFNELNENWFNYGNYFVEIDYESLDKEGITYEDIVSTQADVLIISNAWTNQHFNLQNEYTDSEIQAIKRYVEEGHGLIGTAGTISEYSKNNAKLGELFGLKEKYGLWNSDDSGIDGDLTFLVDDETLTKNIPLSYTPGSRGAAINLETDESKNVAIVSKAIDSSDLWKNIFVSAYKPSLGASIYFSSFPEYSIANEFDKQFFYNAIVWTKENIGESTKDISLSNLQVPAKIKIDEDFLISAKIKNNGQSSESNVFVNLLINDAVKSIQTINLAAGQEKEINFSIALEQVNRYELKLEVEEILGESYLVNNNLKTNLIVHGALLNGNNEDYLIDLDNNGMYDFLAIPIGIDVYESGPYEVILSLESRLGVELYPGANSFNELDEGENNITVLIPLHIIKKFRLNGPYKIKNIGLSGLVDSESGGKEMELMDANGEGFVTEAYRYSEFRDSVGIVQDSFYDYGFDEDGDGLYNYLVVNFSTNITLAGNYHFSGGMLLGEENLYSDVGSEFDEPGIYNISLNFLGKEIRASRLDGPYKIESISIYHDTFQESNVGGESNPIYTTNEYSYENFETFINIYLGWPDTGYLIVGEESNINIPIYNDGTEDVGDFNISLYLIREETEELIETKTIEGGIVAGGFKEVVFDYIPSERGYLKFEARTDLIDENEEDNVVKFGLKSYFQIGADLSLYTFIWDEIYIVGENSEIEFSVYNNGLEKAEDVVASLYSVEFRENEEGTPEEVLTLIDSMNLNDLDVGESVGESIDYTPSTKYNPLFLKIESSNEQFPGDNEYYFSIDAKLRGADLGGYVEYSNSNFVVGTENEIKFVLKNIGTETAEDVVASLYSVEWIENEEGNEERVYTLIDEKPVGEVLADDFEEIIFVYVPDESQSGKNFLFAVNITASNDADLENNLYLFGIKIAPQSKIMNNKDIDIIGNLTFKLQKKEDYVNWNEVPEKNYRFEKTISANSFIKLDEIFNPLNVVVDSSGNYRVYASFESDNQIVEGDWKFYAYF